MMLYSSLPAAHTASRAVSNLSTPQCPQWHCRRNLATADMPSLISRSASHRAAPQRLSRCHVFSDSAAQDASGALRGGVPVLLVHAAASGARPQMRRDALAPGGLPAAAAVPAAVLMLDALACRGLTGAGQQSSEDEKIVGCSTTECTWISADEVWRLLPWQAWTHRANVNRRQANICAGVPFSTRNGPRNSSAGRHQPAQFHMRKGWICMLRDLGLQHL